MTNESPGTVKPFVEKSSIEYLIALDKQAYNAYKSSGIPAAWLVSPMGEIIWQGHPSSLPESMIEEQLQNVRLLPSFDLEGDLDKAGKYLSAGKMDRGLQALEKALDGPQADKAREVIEQVKEYGNGQLAAVKAYADAGDYTGAMELLQVVEKVFKGTDIGDKAKAQRSEWKRDAKVKTELTGEAYIAKARELIGSGDKDTAAAYLRKVISSDKFAGTKAKETAEKLLQTL